MTQASFKLLLLYQVPEHVLYLPFESGVSVPHSSLGILKVSPAAFKAKCSRSVSSWCRAAGLGSLIWGSDFRLLREHLCNLMILCL